MLLARIDRYLIDLVLGTFGSVVGILMCLMVLEHIPRLLDITRLSGQRGYIIGQTVLGLLPEYAGIGVVVGVYVAVGMAIRKLALRGELSVIEATGIGPARWMRMPLILTMLGAAFVLLNQGWLMPNGEERLEDIGRRMANGDFGVNIPEKEFIDLGGGTTLYFDGVADANGTLEGIFIADAERVYSASSGTLSIAPDGTGVVHLANGQSLDKKRHGTLNFASLMFRLPGPRSQRDTPSPDARTLRQETLGTLLANTDPTSRSAAYARMLWCLLVLVSGALAFILARPPMRSASALGLIFGLSVLIGFLKSIALLETATLSDPEVTGVAIAIFWIVSAGVLYGWYRQAGDGAFDMAVLKLLRAFARQ